MPSAVSSSSHFVVLKLPEPTTSTSFIAPTEVKKAYKQALLLHHPDKSKAVRASKPPATTVDDITLAYQTLISPLKQREYVHQFIDTRASARAQPPANETAAQSFETVDLDDMQYDETQRAYYRPCRCGRQDAYMIKEEELEERIEEGEVSVGCEGCSLWICVQFGVTGG